VKIKPESYRQWDNMMIVAMVRGRRGSASCVVV
jgi:hypothetical protein